MSKKCLLEINPMLSLSNLQQNKNIVTTRHRTLTRDKHPKNKYQTTNQQTCQLFGRYFTLQKSDELSCTRLQLRLLSKLPWPPWIPHNLADGTLVLLVTLLYRARRLVLGLWTGKPAKHMWKHISISSKCVCKMTGERKFGTGAWVQVSNLVCCFSQQTQITDS